MIRWLHVEAVSSSRTGWVRSEKADGRDGSRSDTDESQFIRLDLLPLLRGGTLPMAIAEAVAEVGTGASCAGAAAVVRCLVSLAAEVAGRLGGWLG